MRGITGMIWFDYDETVVPGSGTPLALKSITLSIHPGERSPYAAAPVAANPPLALLLKLLEPLPSTDRN